MGFHHAISVEPGAPLMRSEGPVLCAAVALLMAALIAIGAANEVSKRRIGLQSAVLLLVGGLGLIAPGTPAVLLVISLGFCALIQTILAIL